MPFIYFSNVFNLSFKNKCLILVCAIYFHIIDLMGSISCYIMWKPLLFMFSKYAVETFLMFHILLHNPIFHI